MRLKSLFGLVGLFFSSKCFFYIHAIELFYVWFWKVLLCINVFIGMKSLNEVDDQSKDIMITLANLVMVFTIHYILYAYS